MTALARRDPLHLEFPEWMTRWLEERGMGERAWAGLGTGIRVEELDEEGAHVIRAELPGIDPDKDVEISVHDGMLHIAGERTERKQDQESGCFRSEFRYGRFERALPLPAGASTGDVSASYKDGVLEVRVPLQEAAREAARIPVRRA
jgi:HSP20 family protein